MKEVESGVWAIFTGDISQDDLIDFVDYASWEAIYLAFGYGQEVTDLNGDGLVDFVDYAVWEANYLSFIFASYPY